MIVAGVLLAAGSGARMGGPKALVLGASGRPWVVDSARTLTLGGCAEVHVTVGAEESAVREALDGEDVHVIDVGNWAEGVSASLRRGLAALESGPADAALIHLVDLPDVGPDVVERVLAAAGVATLARATYDGLPGHPVLIGREHWAELSATLSGDSGAKAYLSSRAVTLIECGDLATGQDIDSPDRFTS